MRSLSRRDDRAELMDTVECAPAELADALRFLEATNRWFGGTATILRHLSRWSVGWPRDVRVRILDVGTGAADIPVGMARWAARRGLHVEVVGLDLVEATARHARARTAGIEAITIVTADLFAFAERDETFDYVVANLFLHHIEIARTVEALRVCDRLARRGLVVSDLRRSWPGLLAVGALSLAVGNRIVRHDGPLSVRRAFTAAELDALASEAGLDYLRARNEPWFRVSLAGEKR